MPLVRRSSRAQLDLTEAALRIAGQNLAVADRWRDVIEDKCRLLAHVPELGRKRHEPAPELRSLPVGNYVIFYRLIPDGIQVIRVLHATRDIPALFG